MVGTVIAPSQLRSAAPWLQHEDASNRTTHPSPHAQAGRGAQQHLSPGEGGGGPAVSAGGSPVGLCAGGPGAAQGLRVPPLFPGPAEAGSVPQDRLQGGPHGQQRAHRGEGVSLWVRGLERTLAGWCCTVKKRRCGSCACGAPATALGPTMPPELQPVSGSRRRVPPLGAHRRRPTSSPAVLRQTQPVPRGPSGTVRPSWH